MEKTTNLGSRRELFVDDELFEELGETEFILHQPQPKEIAIRRDTIADDHATSYYSIIHNGEKYVMYYTAHGFGQNKAGNWPHQHICRAESEDGVHWKKPNYGIYEFKGTKENNIVYLYDYDLLDNFYAIYDTNPKCKEEERYKAVAERVIDGRAVLSGVVSPDGIHWTDIGTIITDGSFDTLNTFYFDHKTNKYRAYVRGWQVHKPSLHLGESALNEIHSYQADGSRCIKTAESDDFRHWSPTVELQYEGKPYYQLYTNNIAPYYRAPHMIFGFPTRYYERPWNRMFEEFPNPERRWGGRYAQTDGIFMVSRDGLNFRRYDDVPIFPSGIEGDGNWVYGDAYPLHGMVETPSERKNEPNEISMFVPDNAENALRRYTIRLDGFVSLHSKYPETEILSKPFYFEGSRLEFNYRTTVSGHFFVELQDIDGKPYRGFELKHCDEMFGDTVARNISWRRNQDVSPLSGKIVRMRIVMRETDLFSFRFYKPDEEK